MIHTVIFDWKRTLYDPDTKTLIRGTKKILNFLKKKQLRLVLIGKGNEDMYQEVKRLQVEKFFSNIIFQEGSKDSKLYTPFVTTDPRKTLFVGDRVRSEIQTGNTIGSITLLVKQGKFASEEPLNDLQKPTYTVFSLLEIPGIIEKKIGRNSL